jgi:hypothetical protein
MQKTQLIAPCGINCAVCFAHLREQDPCPGCRRSDAGKPITRIRCAMKKCERRDRGGRKFCFECRQFPCEVLLHLDKRYRTKYHMSPIENLQMIRDLGARKFLESEQMKWTCTSCGETICVHKAMCVGCGRKRTIPQPGQ